MTLTSPAPSGVSTHTHTIFLADENATETLARQLSPLVCYPKTTPGHTTPGGRIHLRGDLGAGKTCFARAFLRAAGVTGRIKSPSYALLEDYNLSNLYLYHFDFYRFSDSREWVDAGFRDILQSDGVVLIEWPEHAGALLSPPDLDIHLEYSDSGRYACLTSYSDKGKLWLTTLALNAPGSVNPEPPAAA